MDFKFKETAKLAGLLTASMLILNFALLKIFGTGVKNLFALVNYPSILPNPINPISMQPANKLLAVLAGYVSIDFGSIAILFLASFIAVLIGTALVSMLRVPSVGIKGGKIASIVLVGTVPLYLIFVGMTIPSVSAIIGVLLYTVPASILTAYLAEWLSVKVD